MSESKMSDEELVDKYVVNSKSIRDKFRSRLKRGREAIELVEFYRKNKTIQALENLKCCGNCGKYGCLECPKMINKEGNFFMPKIYPSNNYCPNWQSDGLSRKERE